MCLRRSLFFVACLCVMSACSVSTPREPKFIEDIRPVPPALKVINFNIQRKDLLETLQRSEENSIRLVPVYQNVSVRQTYEYRVFDIKEGSVYALLGLQQTDIVVAADRFLLKRPEQFPSFVQLLPQTNEASIEIRRGGEARLLRYRFLPSIPLGN